MVESAPLNNNPLKSCEHGEYQIYCSIHDCICCVDCQISEHMQCGKDNIKSIKNASAQLIQKLEDVNN